MSLLAVHGQDFISIVPRANRVPWVGAIVLLVATLSILFGKGIIPPLSGVLVPFEIQATDVGGQMHIRWNGRADDVARAENAIFEVADGKKEYRFPVSRGVLSSGALEYVRRSDDVAATLILYKDGRETERRTVRSVSAP